MIKCFGVLIFLCQQLTCNIAKRTLLMIVTTIVVAVVVVVVVVDD